MIESCQPQDAEQICAIYNPYVAATTISFEVAPVSSGDMAERIRETIKTHPWLVWREGAVILGYAYATHWRVRAAYEGSAETTVYISEGARGRGIGSALYLEVLKRLRLQGRHLAIGGIALPNEASVALHERLGFEKAAHFPEVGEKFGRKVDVGYWVKRLVE